MDFGDEITAFLEGGCALIVGTVGPDGLPHANRGWGLTVLAGERRRVRLLLDADDVTAIQNLRAGGQVAITGADVPSLRSMQVKGRATGIELANVDDRLRSERYRRAFFEDVSAMDGTPWEHLQRLVPSDLVACTVEVEELFDQTPGPEAGACLGRERP